MKNIEAKCINQVFKPNKAGIVLKGYGDCTECETNYKNKDCKGYYPMTLRTFEVKN